MTNEKTDLMTLTSAEIFSLQNFKEKRTDTVKKRVAQYEYEYAELETKIEQLKIKEQGEGLGGKIKSIKNSGKIKFKEILFFIFLF